MRTRSVFATTGRTGARAVLALALAGSAAGQVTRRVSVDSAGAQGNGQSAPSLFPNLSISANGRYVAFQSRASNLVPGDTNNGDDIFVRDRWLGTTERVNLTPAGGQDHGGGADPAMSADGRFICFWSDSATLVAGDTNNARDVFVRDRQLGLTERVSLDSAGAQANHDSGHHDGSPVTFAPISADGRYVAFWSRATNLVAGDTNGAWDIFVRDRQLGTTERVSVASDGTQANGDCYNVRMSPDGRFVGFDSLSSNLSGGDSNFLTDVFVRDRQLGTTHRVSVSSVGAQGNGNSYYPSMSDDGRYVGFYSNANNLVAGDTNPSWDVFVHDRQTGVTELACVDSGGVQGNGPSGYPHGPWLSADGRYVVFDSEASNLVAGDANGARDVFLRDRQLGTTTRISVDTGGTAGNSNSAYSAITPDARYVAFHSEATNLVPGDTNAAWDVFVHDRDATGFTSFCHPGVDGVIACPCSNPPAGTGLGCDNFGAGPADSGTLTATGISYLTEDTLVLHATGENNTSFTVFWTGTTIPAPLGVAHGAGVRCVGGLNRLYTGSAAGGAISKPSGADPSVSARSAAVGAPISAGQTRYYFTIYRDPSAAGPCGSTASTINLTNAGAVGWNL